MISRSAVFRPATAIRRFQFSNTFNYSPPLAIANSPSPSHSHSHILPFSPIRSISSARVRFESVSGSPLPSTASDSTLLDSPLFNKFVNKFMRDGRRGPVEKAILASFSALKTHTNRNPHTIFLELIESLRPLVGLMKKSTAHNKLGDTALVLIPVPLKERRQVILALQWLRECILQSKQKNSRRREKKRSPSRRKGEWDIFHAAHSNQQLNKLMQSELIKNAVGHQDLLKKKSDWYAKVAENRTYVNYRWV